MLTQNTHSARDTHSTYNTFDTHSTHGTQKTFNTQSARDIHTAQSECGTHSAYNTYNIIRDFKKICKRVLKQFHVLNNHVLNKHALNKIAVLALSIALALCPISVLCAQAYTVPSASENQAYTITEITDTDKASNYYRSFEVPQVEDGAVKVDDDGNVLTDTYGIMLKKYTTVDGTVTNNYDSTTTGATTASLADVITSYSADTSKYKITETKVSDATSFTVNILNADGVSYTEKLFYVVTPDDAVLTSENTRVPSLSDNITGGIYFIGLTFASDTQYTSMGGAIYNTSLDEYSISANFIGNSATGDYGSGGAIYNSGTIGNITGDFIANFSGGSKNGTSSIAGGGAIFNSGIIKNITGNFIGNTASKYGGAINNYINTSGTATIGDITGDFIGNSSASYGGAIYNNATITFLVGDFINNYVTTTKSSTTAGGAIYNLGTIGNVNEEGNFTGTAITGDFTGNYAESASTASGGAIYNMSNADTIAKIGNIIATLLVTMLKVQVAQPTAVRLIIALRVVT